MFNILNNLELVTTFMKVCERGTLREAARALDVSQATVSLRLRKLQTFFTPPLFIRQGRRLQITPQGRDLYSIASENLNGLNADLGAINHASRLASRSPISVGGRLEIFFKLHSRLEIDFPLQLVHHDSRSALQGVLDGKINCAITHVIHDSADLIYTPLFTDRFVFVAPRSLLRTGDSIDAARLQALFRGTQVVSYDEQGALLGRWLAGHGLALDSVERYVLCDNWLVLRNFLLSGNCCGIFPESYLRDIGTRFTRVEIPEDILAPHRFHFVYRRQARGNKRLIELPAAFRKCLA